MESATAARVEGEPDGFADPARVDGVDPVPARKKASMTSPSHWRPRPAARVASISGRGTGPVGPGRVHRVEAVGHRQDPGHQWDRFPFQPVGISGAVVPLVVREHRGQQVRDPAESLEDPAADQDVLGDLREFLGRQRAPLAQDRVGHADLADVVEQSGEVDVAQFGLGEPQLAGQLDGDPRNALAVAAGVGVLGVDGRGQRADQAREEVLDLGLPPRAARLQPQQRGERLEQGHVDPTERDDGRAIGARRREARPLGAAASRLFRTISQPPSSRPSAAQRHQVDDRPGTDRPARPAGPR